MVRVSAILLELSNLGFVFPIVVFVYLRRWTRVALFTWAAVASTLHHACVGLDWCPGGATLLRKQDFVLAQTLVPVTVLWLIEWAPRWRFVERLLIFGTLFGVVLVEVFSDEPLWVQVVVAGVSLGCLLVYWIIYWAYWNRLPHYHWFNLCMGFVLTTLGCAFFVVQSTQPDMYNWVHSVWHLAVTLGQTWIALARPTQAPLDAALDAQYTLGFWKATAMAAGSPKLKAR